MKTRHDRGFLLIIIIGLLSLLLVLCVGFLSYARGEVSAVANLRDKSDAFDVFQSAADLTIASINKDLFDAANKFKVDKTSLVSNARDPGDPGYRWWYRPYEKGLKDCFAAWATKGAASTYPYTYNDPTWSRTVPDCVDINGKDQAEWIYLPADFFPVPGVRGRYMVQVLDANAFVNLNDSLDDGMPTQCQMAHMFMDGMGEQDLERYRSRRDGQAWVRTSKAQALNLTPDRAPLRYEEAWRVVSGTVRYSWWTSGYQYDSTRNIISPDWVTTNRTWYSGYGAEWTSLKSNIIADGIYVPRDPDKPIGPNNYVPPTKFENSTPAPFNMNVLTANFPWGDWHKDNAHSVGHIQYGMPFSFRAGIDPDTGRCPVNVNTLLNSGERMPANILNGTPNFTIEAVFNVESLRRIVQISQMTYIDSGGKYQTVMNSPDVQSELFKISVPADKKLAFNKYENLRTKMAYMYQEALCRYFTATYRHSMKRKWAPLYNPTIQSPEDFSDAGTYATAFTSVPVPTHACGSNNYTTTRFPTDVLTFRRWVHDDLLVMCNGVGASVRFDTGDNATNVRPGQIDARVAAACYDNVVPGKPSDLGDFGAGDPLMDLYTAQLGRDELTEDPYESVDETVKNMQSVFGYFYDNGVLQDSGVSTYVDFASGADPSNVENKSGRWLNLRPKGADISIGSSQPFSKSLTEVPARQQAFGPDWFSTELTTTSTCFLFIINAQIVDAKTADPALGGNWSNPREIFSGQWGMTVEVAPDVYNETKAAGVSPSLWPTTGLGYYAGKDGTYGSKKRWPTLFKTALADPALENSALIRRLSVDKNCSTLKERHPAHSYFPNQHGAYSGAASPTNIANTKWQDHWNDTNDSSYRRVSAAKIWLDYRGVKDTDADSYYNSPLSTQKRVVVRAVWSHNQDVNR